MVTTRLDLSIVFRSWRRSALGLVAVVLALSVGLFFLLRQEQPPPDPRDDIDVVLNELDRDRERVLAFARDRIALHEYPGHLRGPLATLWSEAGNDIDRAVLLAEMLDRLGYEVRFVRGEDWDVQYLDDGWHDAGLAAVTSDRVLETIPEEEHWTIAVTALGADSTPEMVFRTAGFDEKPLTIRYEDDLALLNDEALTANSIENAERLDLHFEFRGPGGVKVLSRSRELFTREFDDYPDVWRPDNEYRLFVLTGFVPQSVAARAEGELERLALTFAAASDDAARSMADTAGIDAYPVVPRLIMTGVERPRRGVRRVQIDLVHDGIHAEGEPETVRQFLGARSTNNAVLEGTAIEAVVGAAAVNAMRMVRDGMGPADSTPARLAGLAGEMAFILFEAQPGTVLRVTGEEHELAIQSVQFGKVRIGEETLRDSAEGLAQHVLNHTGGSWRTVLEPPMPVNPFVGTRVSSIGRADSIPTVRVHTDHGLIISKPKGAELARGGVRRRVAVYERHRIHDEDLQSADVFSYHFEGVPDEWDQIVDRRGRTFGMISRDRFQDLALEGTTVLQYDEGLKDELDPKPPVRFFIHGRHLATIRINGRDTTIPVMVIAGDHVSEERPAAAKLEDYPDRLSFLFFPYNKWMVLDDPHYPVLLGPLYDNEVVPETNAAVVTGLGGRVVCEGKSVAGASVSVGSLRTRTIEDGRFWLPLPLNAYTTDRKIDLDLTGPHASNAEILGLEPEVHFRIEHPDIESATYRLQIAEYVPGDLEIACERKQPRYFSVDADNAEVELQQVSPRVRHLILAKLDETPAMTFLVVPRAPSPLGTIPAWLEINPDTGEVYGRTIDGLYGSSVDIKEVAQKSAAMLIEEAIEGLGSPVSGFIDGLQAKADEGVQGVRNDIIETLAYGGDIRETILDSLGNAVEEMSSYIDNYGTVESVKSAGKGLLKKVAEATMRELLHQYMGDDPRPEVIAALAYSEMMLRTLFHGQGGGVAYLIGHTAGQYVASAAFLNQYMEAAYAEAFEGTPLDFELVMNRARREAMRFFEQTYGNLPDSGELDHGKAGILQGIGGFMRMFEEANQPQ